MRISFHGAAQDVTGSCHLIEAAGKRILIDCGLHQGSRALNLENAEAFGFDAAAIDCVLLTHAHLDHCGRLPLLSKRGFKGPIVTTAASRELANLVILDSAYLQEAEATHDASVAKRIGAKPAPPLYTVIDATNTLHQFSQVVDYEKPLDVAPGIAANFFNAGHILGSASVLLEVDEGGKKRSVFFSGDIGNADRPLLPAPRTPAAAQAVVMESTYGDRNHRPYGESVEELYSAIMQTFGRGGNVVIPTFALERAQEILYILRQGIESNRLPPSMPVYVDSPMAISATEIFERYPEQFSPAAAALLRQGKDPFALPGLHFTRDQAASIAINQVKGGAVIMAGSGMATGGRVVHHLRHNLARPEAGVIFVGYAAPGTLARRIIDGAKHVAIFGEQVQVRASIHTVNGFSAHADQSELIAWRQGIAGLETTFIVHGEAPVMHTLAGKLGPGRIEIPAMHQSFEI
ncbi:MAG TPA: MBL fold metallo-hydrolase [Stellaceae bacterium]|jgi:metallo-beta-lactamase family protein|nr:MBL fold metallo-hydrolase [Stellaceae bacterium]